LPKEVYVDMYELHSLQTRDFTLFGDAVSDSLTEIELPAHKSKEMTVQLTQMNTENDVAFHMPIHLRYQLPSSNCYAEVIIPPPQVQIKCSTDADWRIVSVEGNELRARMPVGNIQRSEFICKTVKRIC